MKIAEIEYTFNNSQLLLLLSLLVLRVGLGQLPSQGFNLLALLLDALPQTHDLYLLVIHSAG